MPDITMCTGEGCPVRTKCHRYTAKPKQHWQSYMAPPPPKSDGACESFWDTGTEGEGE